MRKLLFNFRFKCSAVMSTRINRENNGKQLWLEGPCLPVIVLSYKMVSMWNTSVTLSWSMQMTKSQWCSGCPYPFTIVPRMKHQPGSGSRSGSGWSQHLQPMAPHTASTVSVNCRTRGLLTFMVSPVCRLIQAEGCRMCSWHVELAASRPEGVFV